MKKIRKKIDLSVPHLIPDRLRRYVHQDLYDVVKSEKDNSQNSEIMGLWHWLIMEFEMLLKKETIHSIFYSKADESLKGKIEKFLRVYDQTCNPNYDPNAPKWEVYQSGQFIIPPNDNYANSFGLHELGNKTTWWYGYAYFQCYMIVNSMTLKQALLSLVKEFEFYECCMIYLKEYEFSLEEILANKQNPSNIFINHVPDQIKEFYTLLNFQNICADYNEKNPRGDMFEEDDESESEKVYIAKWKRLKPLFITDVSPQKIFKLDRDLSKDHLKFLEDNFFETLDYYVNSHFSKMKIMYEELGKQQRSGNSEYYHVPFFTNFRKVADLFNVLREEYPINPCLRAEQYQDTTSCKSHNSQNYFNSQPQGARRIAQPPKDLEYNNQFDSEYHQEFINKIDPAYLLSNVSLESSNWGERILENEEVVAIQKLIYYNFRKSLPNYYSLIDCNHSKSLGEAIWTNSNGGYYIPYCTDWRPAKDRDIYFFKICYTDYKESLKALLRTYDALRRDVPLDVNSNQIVRFVIYPEKKELGYRSADIKVLTSGEFLYECYTVFKKTNELENYPNLKKELTSHLNSIRKGKGKRFLIYPFLRPGNWGLLTGEAGTGKSYVAMAVGMAVATKGKLPFGWEVQQKKCKVLYIDAEVDEEELAARKKKIGIIYKNNKNFMIQSARKVDLLTKEGQALIEKYIDEATLKGPEGAVKLLILDNLHNLSFTVGGTKDNWPTISDWLDKLCERGLAVLLVHHEFMSGKMLGSTFIRNDAQSIVSISNYELEKKDERRKGLPLLARIIKNRCEAGDKIGEKAILNLSTPCWVFDGDNAPITAEAITAEPIIWKKLSEELKEAWLKSLAVHDQMTIAETANFLNVSTKTIENARKKFNINTETIAEMKERKFEILNMRALLESDEFEESRVLKKLKSVKQDLESDEDKNLAMEFITIGDVEKIRIVIKKLIELKKAKEYKKLIEKINEFEESEEYKKIKEYDEYNEYDNYAELDELDKLDSSDESTEHDKLD